MEKQILEAVNEYDSDFKFKNLDEARKYYSPDELIDIWLRYEGIIGYSNKIKKLFETFYNLEEKEDA